MNSCFLQLLGEKTGRVERNRWGRGGARNEKDIFSHFTNCVSKVNLLAFKAEVFFLFVSNRIFTNCHSRSNINCKSHHNKPAASGTNRNTTPTASVPSSNGSVPTTKWPRPDSTDHCTITKRCYYTGSDSHSTGSSSSRPTTGISTDNGSSNVERSIPLFFK